MRINIPKIRSLGIKLEQAGKDVFEKVQQAIVPVVRKAGALVKKRPMWFPSRPVVVVAPFPMYGYILIFVVVIVISGLLYSLVFLTPSPPNYIL